MILVTNKGGDFEKWEGRGKSETKAQECSNELSLFLWDLKILFIVLDKGEKTKRISSPPEASIMRTHSAFLPNAWYIVSLCIKRNIRSDHKRHSNHMIEAEYEIKIIFLVYITRFEPKQLALIFMMVYAYTNSKNRARHPFLNAPWQNASWTPVIRHQNRPWGSKIETRAPQQMEDLMKYYVQSSIR